MKQYVTFGQDHVHNIGGKTFDKDCVATFDAPSVWAGRRKAFELFGPKFCMHYGETEGFEEMYLKYYPRGLISVDAPKP